LGLVGTLILGLFTTPLISDILAVHLSLPHAVEQACIPGVIVVQIK
jgi:hypothetical protein